MTDNQHLPGNPYVDDKSYPSDIHDLATALLAVAYELRTNGAAARLQQQAAHNTRVFLDEIERGFIPAKTVEYRWTDTDGFLRNRDGLEICGELSPNGDGARCIREGDEHNSRTHYFRDRVIK